MTSFQVFEPLIKQRKMNRTEKKDEMKFYQLLQTWGCSGFEFVLAVGTVEDKSAIKRSSREPGLELGVEGLLGTRC